MWMRRVIATNGVGAQGYLLRLGRCSPDQGCGGNADYRLRRTHGSVLLLVRAIAFRKCAFRLLSMHAYRKPGYGTRHSTREIRGQSGKREQSDTAEAGVGVLAASVAYRARAQPRGRDAAGDVLRHEAQPTRDRAGRSQPP